MENLSVTNFEHMDAATLHSFLDRACHDCERVERLYDFSAMLRQNLERLRAQKIVVRTILGVVIGLVLGVAGYGVTMIVGGGIAPLFYAEMWGPNLYVYILQIMATGFVACLFLGLPIIGGLVPYIARKKGIKRTEAALRNAEQTAHDRLENLLPELSVYLQIPDEYRLLSTMQYMKTQVENGNASSWQECVALFVGQAGI
jgi:hypothetical protein